MKEQGNQNCEILSHKVIFQIANVMISLARFMFGCEGFNRCGVESVPLELNCVFKWKIKIIIIQEKNLT